MIPKTVVILDEATNDLESERIFYQVHGEWIAHHFINSLISDLQSLALLAGVHSKNGGIIVRFQNDFPLLSIMKSKAIRF